MSSSETQRQSLRSRIYGINDKAFEAVALDVFQFQYTHNALYKNFCDVLRKDPAQVSNIASIPFLPISFFRDHEIKTGAWNAQTTFRSSGTTGSVASRHLIRDMDWYNQVAALCFSNFLGDVRDYTWLGLLPSYLERPDSSLIHMVQYFMKVSHKADNNFFSKPDRSLWKHLLVLYKKKSPTIVIGVSYALLDLFENHEVPLWENLLVMETGGMKGRREEITREELHARLRTNHPSLRIASEYGMTELLSQAYALENNFNPGPTMRVFISDISDPLKMIGTDQRGAINIIDLANLDTCSFIATDDVGLLKADGSFEVLGRLDQSEVRGCNLMYA